MYICAWISACQILSLRPLPRRCCLFTLVSWRRFTINICVVYLVYFSNRTRAKKYGYIVHGHHSIFIKSWSVIKHVRTIRVRFCWREEEVQTGVGLCGVVKTLFPFQKHFRYATYEYLIFPWSAFIDNCYLLLLSRPLGKKWLQCMSLRGYVVLLFNSCLLVRCGKWSVQKGYVKVQTF